MTTRTVTGNIRSLTDSAVATGTVTFEKIVTSTTGSTIHQSGVTTATTDSSGDFSIALAVPASGSYRYRMILPNGASFYFSIASGASVNVATLIIAETITDQDEVVELLDAYFPVDVDDLTTTTGTAAQRLRVAGGGGLEYRTTEQDLADLRDAGALATPDIGVTVQGYDADLAAIAALSPSNDDVVQRKAGAWTNRTIAQLKTDLAVLPEDASIVAVSSGRDLASTDAGKILECTGTFTLTCPNGLDTGFQCAVVNISTGVITLAATTTLTTKDSAVTIASQYGGATVYHAGSNIWRAIGDLT